MTALPAGTVTLLFTDVEGSTTALRTLGSAYGDALELHRSLIRDAVARHDGVEVDTQGDAFLVAFARAESALQAARDAQEALAAATWPGGVALKVRMGVHAGEPEQRDAGYVGLDVHRGARICAAAHGGQVVLSSVTRALVGEGTDLAFVDLGRHRLRDVGDERLFQLAGPALLVEFPPLRTSTASNLPVLRGPTIGRDEALAELGALLRSDVRLVTLVGPGGAGKSRLAIEAARTLVGDLAHGVHLVRLATIDDAALVATEIARSLGLHDERDAETALYDHLRDRELLLFLDNFEHVTSAAPLVAELVERSTRLVVLCTSRSPLRLSHERVMVVDPLEDDAAVELFVERARTADSRFRLDDSDEGIVRELCRNLDGLPLAIEIVAARAGVLTVHDLAAQMDVCLGAAGAHDLPERQRTLAATLSWSYEILSPAHRALHQRLAVFQGRFTPQAALVGFGATIDDLEALVSAALLRRADMGHQTGLVMLRTVRELALEQLGTQAFEQARRERDAWLDDLVERAAQELPGSDPGDWLAELESWLPDLRASLEDARRSGDHARVVRLISSLERFWRAHLHVGEVRETLAAALAAAPPDDLRLRARALWTLARLAAAQGEAVAAAAPLHEALELFRALGEKREVSFALTELAWMALDTGDLDVAERRAGEALENARSADDERAASSALNALAFLATERGDAGRARELALESLEIRRRIGDRLLIADAALTAGTAALADGDLDAAESALRECLELARAVGDALHEGGALCGLGEAAVLRGEPESARAPLQEALGIFARLGNEAIAAECLVALSLTEEAERGGRLLGAALAARERAHVTAVAVERVLEAEAQARFGDLQEAIRDGSRLTVVDAALIAGVEPALV
ncbi:MAG TPA: tetratricopeptide repeat protein [Gaiella sp.]|nr:tetratricopeptide repeat protein [Gaiella sp.]